MSTDRIEINHATTEERCVDESLQFEHEHARAYEAVETAAQRLELAGAGHEREVALLRAIRRRLSRHIVDGDCHAE